MLVTHKIFWYDSYSSVLSKYACYNYNSQFSRCGFGFYSVASLPHEFNKSSKNTTFRIFGAAQKIADFCRYDCGDSPVEIRQFREQGRLFQVDYEQVGGHGLNNPEKLMTSSSMIEVKLKDTTKPQFVRFRKDSA